MKRGEWLMLTMTGAVFATSSLAGYFAVAKSKLQTQLRTDVSVARKEAEEAGKKLFAVQESLDEQSSANAELRHQIETLIDENSQQAKEISDLEISVIAKDAALKKSATTDESNPTASDLQDTIAKLTSELKASEKLLKSLTKKLGVENETELLAAIEKIQSAKSSKGKELENGIALNSADQAADLTKQGDKIEKASTSQSAEKENKAVAQENQDLVQLSNENKQLKDSVMRTGHDEPVQDEASKERHELKEQIAQLTRTIEKQKSMLAEQTEIINSLKKPSTMPVKSTSDSNKSTSDRTTAKANAAKADDSPRQENAKPLTKLGSNSSNLPRYEIIESVDGRSRKIYRIDPNGSRHQIDSLPQEVQSSRN